MSDAPITPDRSPHQVACPECGGFFSPRGIATHRRMRHGAAPAAVEDLGTTLTRIATVLERLESRLDPRAATIQPPPAQPVSLGERATDLGVLERGLREVLNEIARVKTETERQIAACRAQAQSEEQKALEQTSFQMLGNLRRRQASLLFRLQEARGEDAIDNSLCI
ncbi:MAG: hypothetical protein ACKVXR_17480 [Planctomycetota bacterium]